MDNIKYIHYGSNSFDTTNFHPIKDIPFYTKPEGSFWASRANENFSWKDRCEKLQYRLEKLDEYFQFTIAPEANIIEIHSCEDLKLIPQASFLAAMYIGSLYFRKHRLV